jgi:RNA polymerase sigma factor FliA
LTSLPATRRDSCGDWPTSLAGTSSTDTTGDPAAALWRAWRLHRDVSARDRLILSHAPLVKYLAGRKLRELPAHCDLDDLVSCGLVALIGAVERFDPTRGATFAQYASTRIAGAILDELRRNDWATRSVRSTERAINHAHDNSYRQTGQPATNRELAKQLHLTPEELDQHQQQLNRSQLLSLNAPIHDTGGDAAPQELGHTLQAPTTEHDPEATALAADRVATIMTAIRSLPPREQRVVLLRAVHQIPNAEVGRMLGISESRVSQIMASARRKLHQRIEPPDPPASYTPPDSARGAKYCGSRLLA